MITYLPCENDDDTIQVTADLAVCAPGSSFLCFSSERLDAMAWRHDTTTLQHQLRASWLFYSAKFVFRADILFTLFQDGRPPRVSILHFFFSTGRKLLW